MKQRSSYKSINDEYLFTEVLNQGKRNAVYLAHPKRNPEQQEVVKMSKTPMRSSRDDSSNLLQEEYNLLSKLSHPNIIKVLKKGRSAAKLPTEHYNYISYEYLENGCLIDFFKQQSLKDSNESNMELVLSHPKKEKIVRTFFKQMVDAVAHLFSKGICHRDIKLDNILVRKNYDFVLSDFDLSSNFFDEAGNPMLFSDVAGSSKYFPPEVWQIIDAKEVKYEYDGKKVDIFSLGILLFCLACGKMPFGFAKKKDPYYYFLYKNCPKMFWKKHEVQDLSEELMALIENLLSFHPNDRLSIERIYRNEWFKGPVCSSEELKEVFE